MTAKKTIALSIIAIIILSNFIPLLSFKAAGMVKSVISDITVYSLPSDFENAEKLVERIKIKQNSIVSAIPGTDSDNIDLVIYPTHKSLHLNTFGLIGYFFPDWYIGKNTKSRVLLTSPSAPGPSHTRESIEKAAVHEYVHVLTDRVNSNIGYWMKEGLALYLADQIPDNNDVLNYSGTITYDNFSTRNPFKFADYGGYSMAYSYIEYLDETYGWNNLISLIEPDTAFIDITGISEEEAFDSWKLWVKKRYA